MRCALGEHRPRPGSRFEIDAASAALRDTDFNSPGIATMIITHLGKTPRIDPQAYVAPNAAICGDVTIGAGCRILFGAQVIAEGGSIVIGRECIVMENAVLRANQHHPLE